MKEYVLYIKECTNLVKHYQYIKLQYIVLGLMVIIQRNTNILNNPNSKNKYLLINSNKYKLSN